MLTFKFVSLVLTSPLAWSATKSNCVNWATLWLVVMYIKQIEHFLVPTKLEVLMEDCKQLSQTLGMVSYARSGLGNILACMRGFLMYISIASAKLTESSLN